MLIVKCRCLSPYLDGKLGVGNRWATIAGKKSEKARCVICTTEHSVPSQEKK